MRTIISTSGGLDSTYVLWKTLSTTDDEVTAVFLDFSNIDVETAKRKYDIMLLPNLSTSQVDIDRFNAICRWIKDNVRNFNSEIHNVDLLRFRRGLDVIERPNTRETYFVDLAIERINANLMDRIISGYGKVESDGFAHGGTKNGVRRPSSAAAHDRFVLDAKRGQIDFPLIESKYTQANALIEMPQELIDLTHSCIKDNSTPCNKCIKCDNRNFSLEMVKSGKTSDEIYDYLISKCIQEDGTWISLKFWLKSRDPKAWQKWPMPQWPQSYKCS
jgi:7-cyano-7-deazaguanine synthase in queuosine biosynthesis